MHRQVKNRKMKLYKAFLRKVKTCRKTQAGGTMKVAAQITPLQNTMNIQRFNLLLI